MISKRLKILIVLLLVLIIGLFYLTTIREGHRWAGDFSMYIHHAKNIVEGKPFGETGYIYNPHYPQLGPKTYPPIFPLLLTPLVGLFGSALLPMKIEMIFFFLLCLLMIYLITSERLAFDQRILILAIIGFNPFFWDFKDYVLSDIPFFLIVLVALYLFTYFFDHREQLRNPILITILIGLLMYLAYGTKTIGFILLPSLLIYDFIKYRRLSKHVVIASVVFILLVILQSFLIHSDSDYFDQFFPFRPLYIFQNILIYTDSLFQFFNSGFSAIKIIHYVIFTAILLLAFWGYFLRLKSISINEIFLPLYLAIVILWPTHQGFRFLIPFIPFFLLYFFVGINYIIQRIHHHSSSQSINKFFTLIIILCTASTYTLKYISLNFTTLNKGVHKQSSVDLFDYIRHETDESDVFMFKNPRILSLYSDRSASVYFNPDHSRDFWDYMKTIHATHLIIEKSGPEYILQLIKSRMDVLHSIYSNEDFILYKIIWNCENDML